MRGLDIFPEFAQLKILMGGIGKYPLIVKPNSRDFVVELHGRGERLQYLPFRASKHERQGGLKAGSTGERDIQGGEILAVAIFIVRHLNGRVWFPSILSEFHRDIPVFVTNPIVNSICFVHINLEMVNRWIIICEPLDLLCRLFEPLSS